MRERTLEALIDEKIEANDELAISRQQYRVCVSVEQINGAGGRDGPEKCFESKEMMSHWLITHEFV